MKKLVFTVILISVATLAFAGGLTFDMVSETPLWAEPKADPYAYRSDLKYIMCQEGNPREYLSVLVGPDGKMTYLPLSFTDKTESNYVHLKVGAAVGIFRFGAGPVKFEGNLNAYLNSAFCAFGGTDAIAWDGSYFIGGSIQYKDRLTLRAGVHHFSTHLDFELVQDCYRRNIYTKTAAPGTEYVTIDGVEYTFIEFVEYVRQNPVLIGLSYSTDPGRALRASFYAEAEFPFSGNNMRPFAHCPEGFENKFSGGPQALDWNGRKENATDEQVQNEKDIKAGTYSARRIHFGAELSWEFADNFIAFVSADMQLHEDGKTLHRPGGYSSENPWERELSVSAGLEFTSPENGHSVMIQATWHDGRFFTPSLFYQRSRYLELGFSLK